VTARDLEFPGQPSPPNRRVIGLVLTEYESELIIDAMYEAQWLGSLGEAVRALRGRWLEIHRETWPPEPSEVVTVAVTVAGNRRRADALAVPAVASPTNLWPDHQTRIDTILHHDRGTIRSN